MPKYQVRVVHEVVEWFDVEAKDAEEAQDIANENLSAVGVTALPDHSIEQNLTEINVYPTERTVVDFNITGDIAGTDFVVCAQNKAATEYLVSLGRQDDVDDVTVLDKDELEDFITRAEDHAFFIDKRF